MEDTFTFAELEKVNAFRFLEVEAYGRKVAIGTVSSAEMIDWLEANDVQKKEAGVRLLVKSLVEVTARDAEGNVTDGRRLPADQREHWVEVFRNKDAQENGKIIAAALKLNGLDRAAAMMAALKNASRGANPVASPIASPSQPAE